MRQSVADMLVAYCPRGSLRRLLGGSQKLAISFPFIPTDRIEVFFRSLANADNATKVPGARLSKYLLVNQLHFVSTKTDRGAGLVYLAKIRRDWVLAGNRPSIRDVE